MGGARARGGGSHSEHTHKWRQSQRESQTQSQPLPEPEESELAANIAKLEAMLKIGVGVLLVTGAVRFSVWNTVLKVGNNCRSMWATVTAVSFESGLEASKATVEMATESPEGGGTKQGIRGWKQTHWQAVEQRSLIAHTEKLEKSQTIGPTHLYQATTQGDHKRPSSLPKKTLKGLTCKKSG